jgi:L-iditol 2-dehydrogenase
MPSMKAAVFYGPEKLVIEERPIPSPADGDIVLRIDECLICGSDLRIYMNGNPRVQTPRVLGHEIIGRVSQSANMAYHEGDKISLGADCGCGLCYLCQHDKPQLCLHTFSPGYEFDGGFQEFMYIPNHFLEYGPVKKINSIDLPNKVMALAEPLACVFNGIEKVGLQKNESVIIFGAGPMGILIGVTCKLLGSGPVFMFDPNPKRQDAAKPFGFDYVGSSDYAVDMIKHLTHSCGADVAFVACGSQVAQKQAFDGLSIQGRMNVFAGVANAEEVPLDTNRIHYEELVITGSHGSNVRQHYEAIQFLKNHPMEYNRIVTYETNLEDIRSAFRIAMSGNQLKVGIKFS